MHLLFLLPGMLFLRRFTQLAHILQTSLFLICLQKLVNISSLSMLLFRFPHWTLTVWSLFSVGLLVIVPLKYKSCKGRAFYCFSVLSLETRTTPGPWPADTSASHSSKESYSCGFLHGWCPSVECHSSRIN